MRAGGVRGLGRPGSYLRWDVPVAVFAGGRCVRPAGREWSQFQKPEGVASAEHVPDANGWQREGFVGHAVTQTGVGWVLGDVPDSRREAAFAHDSWSLNSRWSGTHPGMKLSECSEARSNAGPYAKTRFAALRLARKGGPYSHMDAPRRRAAAWKWRFANTSFNCWHSRWEAALTHQRKYAMLLAYRERTGNPDAKAAARAECSIWGSLYNQVHARWNESQLQAIFYVNDTITTPEAATEADAAERQRLRLEALRAAERARLVAMLAQRIAAVHIHAELPIVQFVHTDECYRPSRLLERLAPCPKGRGGVGCLNPRASAPNASRAFGSVVDYAMRREAAASVAAAVFRPVQ